MFTLPHRRRAPQSAAPCPAPTHPAGTNSERASQACASPPPVLSKHVGLFWSAEGTGGPSAPFAGSGANVASACLTRALASVSDIRTLDIFVPLTKLDECRREFAANRVEAEAAGPNRTSIYTESDLPTQLRSFDYDVLHHTGFDLTSLSYLRSRYTQRVFPVTCSQHGISYSWQLQSRFVRLLTAHIYPCDAIVCLTAAARQAMERRLLRIADSYSRAWDHPVPPLPRLELIPWGVDTQRFAPRNQADARRDLELPADRPIVLCIGRLQIHDKMDWTPLLLAFERLCRTSKSRPLLVLAGADPSGYGQQVLAHAVQLGIREHVRAFFNLPPAMLAPLYSACDVFVSPTDSPSESFGLTIAEAMASGRPVVASDWDGYKELIVHGETGFKVRTDWADCLGTLNALGPCLWSDQEHLHVGQSVAVDVAQMANHLTQLLDNDDLRQQMGLRARAHAVALYDWPVVVRQWQELWAELLAVARSINRTEPDRLDYLRPEYFRDFAHYATRIIGEETPVSLTPRGQQLLDQHGPLLLHPLTRGFLEPRLLHATLAAVKAAGWLAGGLQVGAIMRVLEKAHGVCRDSTLMHIMWLAKYDLVSLGGAGPLPRDHGTDQSCANSRDGTGGA